MRHHIKRLTCEVLESRELLSASAAGEGIAPQAKTFSDIGSTGSLLEADNWPMALSAHGTTWTNQNCVYDVNNDGAITYLDFSQELHFISTYGGGQLPRPGASDSDQAFVDVNADGMLSAVDLLRLVNRLNESNYPPVISGPEASTAVAGVATAFSVSNATLITVSDVDSYGALIQTSLQVQSGILTLGGIQGLTFLNNTSETGNSIVFLASIVDTNAALRDLQYQSQLSGHDALTLTIDDLGNTGLGAVHSTTKIILIEVQPASQSPAIAPISRHSIAVDTLLSVVIVANDPLTLPLTYQIIRIAEQPTVANNSSAAVLDPDTGVFSWTPSSPGTYRFLVAATNVGSPPLADTAELTVIVSP